jgi:hypothetical protein
MSKLTSWLLHIGIALMSLMYQSAVAQVTTTGAEQIPPGVAPLRDNVKTEMANPVSPANSNLIVFRSQATNLTGNPANFLSGLNYLYLYSPDTKTTTLLSTNTSGAPSTAAPQSGGVDRVGVSEVGPDGLTYAVAFSSTATDLVPNMESGQFFYNQVFLKIPKLPEGSNTFLLSKAFGVAGNTPASGESNFPTLSLLSLNPLVFRVCFTTTAKNLVADEGTTPGSSLLVCRDFDSIGAPQSAWTTLSLVPSGAGSSVGVFSYPTLSGDGQTLAFSSTGSIDGLPQNSGFTSQVYSYKFATKQFKLVSRTSAGGIPEGNSNYPSISYSGSFIGFVYNPLPERTSHVKGFTGQRAAFMFHSVTDDTYSLVNTNAATDDGSFGSSVGAIDRGARLAIFSDDGLGILGSTESNLPLKTQQVYVKSLISNATARVSVNSSLVAGSGSSGLLRNHIPLTLNGGESKPFAVFISDAANLASTGYADSDPYQFLYRSPITLSATAGQRTFSRNIRIESPPDVRILKTRKSGSDISLTFEKFKLNSSIFGSLKSLLETLASSRARLTYQVELQKIGSKKRTMLVSSRNTTTIRKLKAGSYTVRYRAVATKGKRVIRSLYSPKASLVLS